MDISGVSPEATVLATSAEGRALARQAAVIRKTQDVASAQAQSLIELVKAATPEGVGTRLNVYA
jgi:hypothetical protein